ncbi:hypothetical protein DOY81_006868 [Sarcophaga bullata]|nr:hypothetical protein DOY81_006868 [Sarcophaga bullata]
MCYVCENCAKVTAETPQFECNEEFFNTGGTTASSVQTTTTTELPKTTDPMTTEDASTTTTDSTTVSSTTTQESSTTEMTTETSTEIHTETTMETTNETSTTEKTTESTTPTTASTEPQPPTPPTVGPPMTTTALPTPPNPDTIPTIDDVEKLNNQTEAHEQHVNKDDVDEIDMEKATTKAYKPSAEFRVRQQRSVSDVTYHCYKIQATTTNGTMVINRGCSRVQTMESVCGQWEVQHPNEHINKCYPCTRSKCNGSSALSVSITALFVAVIAVFMHRK